ncbi:MAG: helix-turn-helix domain-containing protein [Kiritimatiellaeota bacterium]|nr:helix-turn-helix domain-containing protein [Kiritimatiellota bacterium]
MAQLTIEVCRRLAQARRDKGMTQSRVAREVGCQQSAISMLEAGLPGKLSRESIAKLAKLLGVELPAEKPAPALVTARARGYCPNALCPSNLPYLVQERLLFWPRLQDVAAGPRCAYCGDMLETHCPECGAPAAQDGAVCNTCGAVRVTDTLPPDTDRDAWLRERRRELAEWRHLLEPLPTVASFRQD